MVCALNELPNFTIGRVTFPVRFLGELAGCVVCCAMFGKEGTLYGLEGIDLTDQVDCFTRALSGREAA